MDLYYLLIVFGVTNAISFLHVGYPLRRVICGLSDDQFYSKIKRGEKINSLRNFRHLYLGRLIHCHACTGFWVGLLISFFWNNLKITGDIFNGFLSSAFCFVIWVILVKLGAKNL